MDQQFRLKWNNHCNTLLQVFGNLLKTETLVDCTIGADGQYLKAHKVVVSACSPYFQSLFTEHFDKHPIIILKDIKFGELQSMIDYMYEGEVNISQDQLPSFLKAAASIQLKGLTQNVKSEAQGGPPAPHSPPASKPLPSLASARGALLSNGSLTPSSMLNVELEEGQQRKKRKLGGGGGAEPHASSASSSPSLVPDLVTPSVILDVPGETQNGGQGAGGGGGNSDSGATGGGGGGGGHMKKEPSEYSGRSEDEEEDGMSHDGWDLSNDGLHDSNSTMSAGDRGQGPHHSTPGGNRPAGGPGGLSAAGPDMSNVDENNQGLLHSRLREAMLARVNGFPFLSPPDHLSLQKKLALDILSFRHHLDMEEEWNDSALGHFGNHRTHLLDTSAPLGLSRAHSGRKENSSPSPLPLLKRKKVMREDGSSENKWVMDHENDVLRDISTGTTSSGDHRPLYSCDSCGKSYLWKQGLNTHKRLHCGKEPRFQCPHCPKRCFQRGNLESHIRNVHAINPATGELLAAKAALSPHAQPPGGSPHSNSSHAGGPHASPARRNSAPHSGEVSSAGPHGPLSLAHGAGHLSPPMRNLAQMMNPPEYHTNASQAGSPSPNHSPGVTSGTPASSLRPVSPAASSVHEPFNLSKHFGSSTAGVTATGN